MNMLETIVPKSDQLNADDLIGGRTMTITVTSVGIKMDEQPVAIHFEGDGGKPYKPGKSMRRVLVNLWGPDANQYAGRSMTLYRDDKVKFGGLDVGGIRISHMSHITSAVTMALTETKAKRKPFTVQPLVMTPTTEPKPKATLADWIAGTLPGHLAACKTAEDVEKVKAGRAYHAAMEKATDAEKADMEARVAEALVRVAAVTEDPSADMLARVEAAYSPAALTSLKNRTNPAWREEYESLPHEIDRQRVDAAIDAKLATLRAGA